MFAAIISTLTPVGLDNLLSQVVGQEALILEVEYTVADDGVRPCLCLNPLTLNSTMKTGIGL